MARPRRSGSGREGTDQTQATVARCPRVCAVAGSSLPSLIRALPMFCRQQKTMHRPDASSHLLQAVPQAQGASYAANSGMGLCALRPKPLVSCILCAVVQPIVSSPTFKGEMSQSGMAVSGQRKYRQAPHVMLNQRHADRVVGCYRLLIPSTFCSVTLFVQMTVPAARTFISSALQLTGTIK